jgi:hypothetical protein
VIPREEIIVEIEARVLVILEENSGGKSIRVVLMEVNCQKQVINRVILL